MIYLFNLNLKQYFSKETFILICAMVGVLLIFLLHVIFKGHYLKVKKQKSLKNERNIRIYIINIKTNEVTYFDKIKISSPKKISMDQFISSFSTKDQKRIKVWLEELKKEQHLVPHHLEVSVFLNSFRANSFAVLDVTYLDYKEGFIHLESHLFPKINQVKSKKVNRNYLKTETEFNEMLQKTRNVDRMTVFAISLFSNKKFDTKNNFKVDHLVTTQLINRLFSFLSPTRFLVQLKNRNICIVDLKLKTKFEAMSLGQQISQEINKYLNINALVENFDYKIGVVQKVRDHRDDSKIVFKELIKNAREMALYAENSLENNKVIFYDENINFNKSQSSLIIDEITNLINNNNFNVKYSPIIESNDQQIAAYYSYITPINSILKSIDDITEHAYQSSLIDGLLSVLIKDTYANFAKITKNVLTSKIVFMNFDLPYYQTMLTYLSKKTYTKGITPVVVYQSNDVEDFIEKKGSVISILKEIKDKNIRVALSFNSFDFEIPEEVLKEFDIYIISQDIIESVTINTQAQIFIKTLIDTLSYYEKEIIGFNLSKWSTIEYFVKSGCHLIESELIASPSEGYELPSRKKLSKLATFNE